MPKKPKNMMVDPEEALMDKKEAKKKMPTPPWVKKGTMKKGK